MRSWFRRRRLHLQPFFLLCAGGSVAVLVGAVVVDLHAGARRSTVKPGRMAFQII